MSARATCMLIVNDIDSSGLCVLKNTKRQPELELLINIEAKILAIVLKVRKSNRRLQRLRNNSFQWSHYISSYKSSREETGLNVVFHNWQLVPHLDVLFNVCPWALQLYL